MRVALVGQGFGLEGSHDRQCVVLARALTDLGVDVHMYCDPRLRLLDEPAVTFHNVPALLPHERGRLKKPVNILSFAAKATRIIRRDRSGYDLVHVAGCTAWEHDVLTVQGVTKAEVARWPERGGQTYRVAHLRARVAPVSQPIVSVLRAIEHRQLRPGAFLRLIVQTEEVKRDLEGAQGVASDSIDVIPPAITIGASAPDADDEIALRALLGIGRETPIILFVGHEFERKGLFEGIDALAGVAQNAHLVVVGSGDSEPFLRSAAELGVADRVHFVGGTMKPERYYAQADLLLHPARWEVWGTPIVEAMAFGVPVVTTCQTGAARAVQSADAGLVVTDSSPWRLREALSELIQDSDLRRAMGERGRAAAVEDRPEAHAARTLETYERALRARARRRPAAVIDKSVMTGAGRRESR